MTSLPRSWLFTPGSRPDRFDTAASSDAGVIILDLEDSVAESQKAIARQHVIDFLARNSSIRQKIAIRINPLNTALGFEDVAALAQLAHGPGYVVVPKSEEPAELAMVAQVFENGHPDTRLVALVESANGVARAAEIARATTRLAAIIFGAADYAADLGQRVGQFRPDYARASLVNAAASGKIVAIDSPFFAVDQSEELGIECRMASAMGFHGKAAIHPTQLGAINLAFEPTAAEREFARNLLKATPNGVGVIDGKMIDVAMIRWARNIK